MRAIRVARFGGPEVLELIDLPTPSVEPTQVLVAVEAVDTLFLDAVIRRGDPGPWSVSPGYVPGSGIAGTVVDRGSAVDPAWAGCRVAAKPGARPRTTASAATVAATAAISSPTDGYAETVAVEVDALVPLGSLLSTTSAAAVVNDGMTAMMLTAAMRPKPDEFVLVLPAAGGVGSLLIQLARAAGATVIAAGRGTEKLASAYQNGAELALDYDRPDWTTRLEHQTSGRGADLVFDGVGGNHGQQALRATAAAGRFLAFGAPGGTFTRNDPHAAARQGLTTCLLPDVHCTPADEHRFREQALRAVEAGTIRPVIGRRLGLDAAAEAHRGIENREVIGKTLLLTEHGPERDSLESTVG